MVPAKERIPELDGIRGVAILLVLLMHIFGSDTLPGSPKALAQFKQVFAIGWSGVDLFFVLSGFLIGGILLDNVNSKSYFKTFYARRFFRIIPVYYCWTIMFILFVKFAGGILSLHTRSGVLPAINVSTYTHFLFLQNLWEQNYVTLAYWWLSPTWSLAVEEQFYLVAPLAIRYLPRRLLPIVLGVVIVVAPLIRLMIHLTLAGHGETPWPAYRLMPCRADALALGIVAAYVWRLPAYRRKMESNPIGLYSALLVFSVGFVIIWWWYPNPNALFTQSIGYTVIALFYSTILLIAISLRSSRIAGIMRSTFLMEFGRTSYCIYLIHTAVSYFCFGLLTHQIINFSGWQSGCVGVLSIAITYTVAVCSWRWLEYPLLCRGHRYKY